MSEITKLFIQGPGGERQTIGGEWSYFPEKEPQKVYDDLLKKPSPFFDFFIFASPRQGTYVVKTPADAFSLAGKSLKDYRMQFAFQEDIIQLHDVGVFVAGKEMTLEKVIDEEGEIKLSDVVIEVLSEQLLRHEQDLKRKLTVYFREALEKTLGAEDFYKRLSDIQYLLESYAYQSAFHFEKREDGSYRLKIGFRSAPLVLEIEGLDANVLREATEWLDGKMSEHLKEHPLVQNRNRSAIGEDDVSVQEALARHQDRRLVWVYPEGVPAPTEDTLTRKLVGLLEGGDPKWAPALKPNDLMPIPQGVLREFLSWLRNRLENEKGHYPTTLEPTAEPGVWGLKVRKEPFHSVRFLMAEVAELKKVGIDLTPEKKILDAGIGHWSKKDWKEFLVKIEKKYRAAGYELFVDHPQLLVSYDDGKTFWLQVQCAAPLIDRFNISVGGENLDLVFPFKDGSLKNIWPKERKFSQKEFQESLKRLAQGVRGKDYLLVGSYPDDPEGGMIPVQAAEENPSQLFVSVRLTKNGRLRIRSEGDLQDSSLKALREGLRWKEGELFRPKEFSKKLARIFSRLDLKIKGEIEYFYQSGLLDVTLPVGRPPSQAMAGLGVDIESGMPVGQAQVALVHRVPKTSQTSITVGGGPTSQSLSLNAVTLPITKKGTRLALGVGLEHNTPPGNSTEFVSVGPNATLLIPLGEEGVASPFQLHLPLRARYIHRKTSDTEEGQFFVGSGAGVSYLDGSLLKPGDLLSLYVGQDVDAEVHGKATDTTSKLKGSYRHPLGVGGLQLEWQLHSYHRESLVGDQLSPFRLFSNTPGGVDFAQGSSQNPHDTKGIFGALLRKELGPVNLFGGVTWSGTREIDFQGALGGLHQGLGFGIGAEIFGFPIYLGWTFMKDGRFGKPGVLPSSLGFYFNQMTP